MRVHSPLRHRCGSNCYAIYIYFDVQSLCRQFIINYEQKQKRTKTIFLGYLGGTSWYILKGKNPNNRSKITKTTVPNWIGRYNIPFGILECDSSDVIKIWLTTTYYPHVNFSKVYFVSIKSWIYMTSSTIGAGTAHFSGTPEFTPGF